MTTLAVFHMKGGVGKTATAVNLSYLAAQTGANTLICDLDPQGAATYYFRVKPRVPSGTKAVTQGGKHLDRSIKGTDYEHLDLLPADLSYRHLAMALNKVKRSAQRLSKSLEPLQDDYAYIILDSPPDLSLLAENIVLAADRLLVPVIPSTLAIHAYEQLLTFMRKKRYNGDKIVAFFSMVERQKNMHRTLMQATLERDRHFLHSTIPYTADIEKMGLYREPVAAFAPRSVAAQAYHHLWKELQARLAR